MQRESHSISNGSTRPDVEKADVEGADVEGQDVSAAIACAGVFFKCNPHPPRAARPLSSAGDHSIIQSRSRADNPLWSKMSRTGVTQHLGVSILFLVMKIAGKSFVADVIAS